MLKRFIPVVVLLAINAISVNESAAQGREDFDKPIQINAERESFDVAKKVAVFDQNVVIRQGSLSIRADHLEVTRRDDQTDVFTATGSPAVYEQQLDDGSPITAEAEIISYDQSQQLLTLSGNVKVSQENSVIQGSEIIYNFATQQLSANRSEDDADRVTTIFMPKKKSDNQNEPTNR
ncbi:lipopolysaccharide transport periplasmic protein LptA [Pseudidiomarina tainanensis]|uniref:Lipopolysaccharide transport periplasmic protein LptA n=1 Tax=Pseudidiomarina tainanensis TaxID=502365 RepID=A0ACD2HHS3_9GAMM|nr:lipopolysaccharide transport periplasmic protein LptA [Pseudidiomarina tainanensis]RZQ56121.1 lipopolysaccharide transport periplasmic protein LptA [Pseudidiomarina tainanensis]